MAKRYIFEVHTPYRRFLAEEVEAVILGLVDGEICVYAGHSAFTAPVKTGILKLKDKNGLWKTAFITEGILEVKEHKTVLMVDAAEWPEEIDYRRAQAAKERVQEQLSQGMLKFETENAWASLKRAEYRLKVWELRDKAGETS
jgi:F-type H+-transporting ATPase subunit epsilon